MREKSFINLPLLYHDMTLKFCVQYYPRKALDDKAFFEQFNPDGSLATKGLPMAVPKLGAYPTRPHIVFDMNEILRCVAFRDRMAEMKR